MTTRKLNGPLGGDYLTDGTGNAIVMATYPITDDNDLGGRLTTAEATFVSQGLGLSAPNPSQALLRIPQPLASPPTFTLGVGSAATAITNSVLIGDDNAALRYFGSPTAIATSGYSSIGQAITNGVINVGAMFGVEFDWYGEDLEVVLRGSATTSWRMWVDDLGYDDISGETGMLSDGLTYNHLYEFGSAAFRRIRIEFSGAGQFFGVRIGPNDSLWRPSSPPGPKVICTGDSFAELFTHWPVHMGWMLGWKDISIVGKGSTGYLDINAGGDTFRGRAQKDIYNQSPDIVVVHGGLNDVAISPALILAECNTFFQEIKANTDAILIVIGLNRSKGANGSSAWIQVRDSIRASAESYADAYVETVGGTYPYNGTFSSYDNAGWLTGSGQVGTTTGTGNADLFVSSDGTHPSVPGSVYRGYRAAQGISAAMPILGDS